MSKKPDFSDLTKKFDLNNIVGSIKSLINPTSGTPEVDPNDAIGLKIAQISVIAQQLSKVSEEQSKEFSKLNQILNGLYGDIERLRGECATKTEAKATTSTVTETQFSSQSQSTPAETLTPVEPNTSTMDALKDPTDTFPKQESESVVKSEPVGETNPDQPAQNMNVNIEPEKKP